MRLFIVLVANFAVAVGARGHHGHHGPHLRPSPFLRHHLPPVKLDETELDTIHPRTVIADTTAAASELEVEVDLDAASTTSNTTISATTAESEAEPDLRAQMAKMSARIEQLEARLKQVQPPPLPPPLAHFLHSLGRGGLHVGQPHSEDEHNVRFEAWRHWHEQRPHRRHHPLLCFILFTAIIYGLYKCTKRCCCSGSDGTNVYPAYVHGNGNGNGLPTARGGVVHNPYVGVDSQTGTFVPSAENPHPIAPAVVPSAPAPMTVGGVPQHQLQHGVVLGTPVSLTG